MKKGIYRKYIFGLLLAGMLLNICFLCTACTEGGTDAPAAAPTVVETQPEPTADPTPTPAPTLTPTPPLPTATPTPTPVPEVRDVYSMTSDACVYYCEPSITGVDMMDVESLGDRLLLIYQMYDPEVFPDAGEDDQGYDDEFNPDDAYTLVFKSVDPVTLEGDEYVLEGRSYYGSLIDVLDNGIFSLYYYGSGPYMLFNDRLELLADISFDEEVTIARFSHNGKWLWYMDADEKLFRINTVSHVKEQIDLPERKGSFYLNEGDGSGIIGVGYSTNDYSDGTIYYYDEDSAELLGQTGHYVSYSFSPDRTRAIRFETGDICSVEVFTVSSDDLFPGEEVADEETGDIIKNADEAVCRIKIANTDEAYSRFIDWERGYYISCSDYYSPEGNIYEYSCYSILTGEKISNYNISGNGYITLYHTLDSSNGILYAEWVKDGKPQLYAWEYARDTVQEYREVFGKFSDIPPAVEEKRREMEEKYGFNFYLGSEVFSSSFDYTLLLWNDYEKAAEVMDVIDEVLSIYPEGFFDQFRIDGIKTLSIYLCGGFEAKAANTINDAIAIATVNNYERLLALDLNWESSLKRTIVHEISHWIDGRIASQAQFGGYSTYDEDWLEQNPADFTYRYSYVGGRTVWKYIFSTGSDNENAYFIDQYSQTYPTEDRARLFEYLMYPDEDGTDYGYLQAPKLQDKLRFYFDVIRKCFDTRNWPEKTSWEEKLDELIDERIRNENEEEKEAEDTDETAAE